MKFHIEILKNYDRRNVADANSNQPNNHIKSKIYQESYAKDKEKN